MSILFICWPYEDIGAGVPYRQQTSHGVDHSCRQRAQTKAEVQEEASEAEEGEEEEGEEEEEGG